jgi:hypothetical protein
MVECVLRDSVIQGNAYHVCGWVRTASPTLITDITLLGNEIAHTAPVRAIDGESGLYVGLGNGAVTCRVITSNTTITGGERGRVRR